MKNPALKILDIYIIKKFLGTFFYSILLIVSIAVIFDLAEKLERAAVEKIRGVRQEISAFQSLMAASRSEMEMSKYGPEEGP